MGQRASFNGADRNRATWIAKPELREASQDLRNSESRRGPILFFEPKSLLQKLVGSMVVVSVVGADVQFLPEKYFAG